MPIILDAIVQLCAVAIVEIFSILLLDPRALHFADRAARWKASGNYLRNRHCCCETQGRRVYTTVMPLVLKEKILAFLFH